MEHVFFNRTLPVSSGCLPVCISEYFCRRRKGDPHVKYKYTDSEYPQHWSVQVCIQSRERQGTGGRGLTQPLTSLVPLASMLAPSPRDKPCPGRGQRESTGQPSSYGLRRCWGPQLWESRTEQQGDSGILYRVIPCRVVPCIVIPFEETGALFWQEEQGQITAPHIHRAWVPRNGFIGEMQ